MTTWSTTDKSANVTLSLSNTKAAATSATAAGVRATTLKSTGKIYFEFTPNASTDLALGIANATESLGDNLGQSLNSLAYFQGGAVQINGSTLSTIQTWVAGNTVCMAVDFGGKLIWFRTNAGNWNNNATNNPATGVGGISLSTLAAGPYTTSMGFDVNADAGTGNWTGSFAQAAPAGFSAWDAGAATASLFRPPTMTGLGAGGPFFANPIG